MYSVLMTFCHGKKCNKTRKMQSKTLGPCSTVGGTDQLKFLTKSDSECKHVMNYVRSETKLSIKMFKFSNKIYRNQHVKKRTNETC